MLPRTRIMSWCLLLTFFYQQVEVDEPHSSNSPLPAVDASITEDSESQIHLIRQRRNVNQQTEYNIDIEISISRNGLSTLLMDLANFSYPIILPFANGTINITNITPTTSCQLVNNETQCTCIGEFIWNSTFCRKYQPCSLNTPATQTCDCIRGYPTEGVFCDDSPITTTPAQSTAPTTRAKTTTTRAMTTTTTLPMTTPIKKVEKKIGLRIRSLNFTAELKDSSSELYQNLTNELTGRLNEAYKKDIDDAVVKVLGYDNGSVLAALVVASNKFKSVDIELVQKNVQNELSDKYNVDFLPDDRIPCSDPVYGTTSFDSTARIACMGSEGDMRRRCGSNGTYGDELNFCLIPEISNLRELTKSPAEVAANFSSLLQELSDVSDNENITEPGNVQAVIEILTTFSNATVPVDETDLAHFLQTVNSVISDESVATWTILSDTTVDANPSSQLLQSVEMFTSRLNLTNGTIGIKQNNLQLVATKITRDENRPDINETFESFNITGYNNLSANIIIPGNEFETAEDNVVVIIAYPTWIDILRNDTHFEGIFEINSLVMTVTLNRKKTFTMNMTFSPRDTGLDYDTATCAFWDFAGKGAWNDSGCTSSQEGGNIACTCEHLTSFSILMSPLSKGNRPLEILTEIGIAISIASLLITIIIEAIVWKHVTKNKTAHTRHVAILNIAINLLIADIWFIVASHVSPETETATCVAATFFIHFFYLALFFWMFTLGLLLIFRLVFIFHDFSKSTLMGISFSVGYLCPLIISVITIGATHPTDEYIRKDACWLGWRDKYPILAFIIPALAIIASNVVVLIVVIFKLLRRTIGDRPRGHSEEQETIKQIVRSIVVLTPILGLTWGFGIPTFQEHSPDAFHYIFTILNAFQGFFIFLFGTCLDSKVREALLKQFSLSRLSSRSRTVQTSSTGRFRSKTGIAFPGRKKNYNITGQVASGSKDKSLSYSTLH